jgi:putative phosphoesterase
MKKIAILSDIHGNILALEKVVEDLQQRQVDVVINLGDHISGPLWPKETVQFLMRQNWIQIRGNHERQLLSQTPSTHGPSDHYAFSQIIETERNWLGALPTDQIVDEDISVFHGSPASDLTYLLETIDKGRVHLSTPSEIAARLNGVANRLVLCGHSHIPRLVHLSDQIEIINPGSVGLPAYEDDYQEHHIIENGSPCARYAILEKNQMKWSVVFISVNYDFEKAADRAKFNHRPDWEIALRTGFMHS